ncbi:uncharacterized protein PGRI_041040 [Penicillium griseofulvum]|uniref:Uncharacterized protein n=1 Tax=Penicillium patulum TaxID=5078 RepID=A0A135L899_PENPA|nr:uncharacterized protein PGRI_041040 [Penicillium griseofulvum]KXG45191.1 hypothetical protein PGRI_041040 [Penicillium griseofulvum]
MENSETQQGHDHEEKEHFDSDYDEGDAVLARGWPRNHRNLVKHGFRPVWTSQEGYPEDEIPADIQEWLDENGQRRSAEIIGPLRSLAWLAGLDELVQAIDHPAYVIEDDIEVIPFGVGLLWPLNRREEEGTVPPTIWAKASGNNPTVVSSPFVTTAPSTTPAAIKGSLETHSLRDLYPASRAQASDHVKCVKIRFDKNINWLEADIRKLVGAPLESENLWFRGLGLNALESTLALFIPERTSHNSDNELGPGFYTASTLQYALEYVRIGGAVMVFKDPALHSTKVWELDSQPWTAWIARWKHLQLAIAHDPIPGEYRTADFIKGAISSRGRELGRGVPTPSEVTQLVACSYEGCKALRDSLEMIIFVERA